MPAVEHPQRWRSFRETQRPFQRVQYREREVALLPRAIPRPWTGGFLPEAPGELTHFEETSRYPLSKRPLKLDVGRITNEGLFDARIVVEETLESRFSQGLIVDLNLGNYPIFTFRGVVNAHRRSNFDARADISIGEGLAASGDIGHLFSVAILYRATAFLHDKRGGRRILGDRAGARRGGDRRRGCVCCEDAAAEDAASERYSD